MSHCLDAAGGFPPPARALACSAKRLTCPVGGRLPADSGHFRWLRTESSAATYMLQ